MYQFDSRVRYSETDEQGRLSVTGILNYLQDCSTLQSEDIGLGIEYLKKTRHAWWLSSWQIIIDRYPVLGEEIVISAGETYQIFGQIGLDHGPEWMSAKFTNISTDLPSKITAAGTTGE